MNLALVAGVAALLVVLLVMRRNTADGGSSPKAKAPKAPKVKAAKAPKAPKEPKAPRAKRVKAEKPAKAAKPSRSRRGRRGAPEAPPEPAPPMPLGASTGAVADADQPTGEFGLPTSPAPGEPDWDAMRAALNGTEVPQPTPADAALTAEPEAAPVAEPAAPVAAPAAHEPAPVWDDDELITEPGWPLPGDMDGGWEDGGDAFGTPAAAPAEGETWLGRSDAPPAAEPRVQETPVEVQAEEDAMWAPDPALAWKAAQEATPEPAAEEPREAAETTAWIGADTDWSAGARSAEVEEEVPAWDEIPVAADASPSIGSWDTPAEPVAQEAPAIESWDTPAEPVAQEAPAIGSWDTPAEPVAQEAPAIGSWDTPAEPVAQEAPAIGSWDTPAEPVAQEAPAIGSWDTPAEPVAQEAPAIGSWDTPAEPVAQEAPAIGSWDTPADTVAEGETSAWDTGWSAAPADAPAAEATDEPSPWTTGDWSSAPDPEQDLVGAGAESAATLAPEAPVEELAGPSPATDWPAADPDDAWSTPAADDAWASAVAEATPPVTSWNVEDPDEWTPQPEPATVAEAPAPAPVTAPEPVATVETVIEVPADVPAEPAAEAVPVPEPVAEAPAPVEEAPVAAAAPADGLAWWDDVEPDASDILIGETPDWMRGLGEERYTGRWSLGGMALQPGHQTLSGVTFRQPLDQVPVAWSLPTRGRPEPGTLVLVVEAMMNCDAKDLKVLTDDGFAPSREGFTLTLTASSTGPFAASGTFRYVEA